MKWEDGAAEELCVEQPQGEYQGGSASALQPLAAMPTTSDPPASAAIPTYCVKIANRYDVLEQEMPDDADDLMGKDAMEVEPVGELEHVHPDAASSGHAPPRSSGKASRGKQNQRVRKSGAGGHYLDGNRKEKGLAAHLNQRIAGVEVNSKNPEEDEHGCDAIQSNPAKVARATLKRRQVVESASFLGGADLLQQVPCDGASAGVPLAGNTVVKEEMDSDAARPTAAEVQGTSQAGAVLTDSQMTILALLAVRLNEYSIACHMKSASVRQMVVATPLQLCPAVGPDILNLESGDVVQCEAVDSSGWAVGCIVAPARLAGQRGCFRCQGMWPVSVELQKTREGDVLRSTSGAWSDVNRSCTKTTTHQRLRQKALYNRMRVARETCG